MTNDRAIHLLESMAVDYPQERYQEAINVAIEALSVYTHPTQDDLICRRDAIRILACEMKAEAMSEGYGDCLIEDYIPEATEWMNDAPSVKPKTGECRTCKRNADNGGVYEDGRTKCPIQEHYALLLDGYCHLYEQI